MIATMGHKGTRRRKRNIIESEKRVKMWIPGTKAAKAAGSRFSQGQLWSSYRM